MSDVVLDIMELSKTYKTYHKQPGLVGTLRAFVRRETSDVYAVKNLSFSIGRGEFVGLLGPNGAGKTTTLKMLTGLIPPSTGRTIAFGQFDPTERNSNYLQRIAMVMGQRHQLNGDLPAHDSFRMSQAIYGISETRYRERVATCQRLFDVPNGLLLKPVRQLSLGERMKAELILALLHEPDLLFLDEPTIGLDFNAARQVRRFLGEANRVFGVTVMLTSHYTKDIEELCERIILINHGQVTYDGPLAGIDQRLYGRKILCCQCIDDHAAADGRAIVAELIGAGRPIREVPAVSTQDAQGRRSFGFDVGIGDVATMVHLVLGQLGSDRVTDLSVMERDLDEIFGDLYRLPAVVPS